MTIFFIKQNCLDESRSQNSVVRKSFWSFRIDGAAIARLQGEIRIGTDANVTPNKFFLGGPIWVGGYRTFVINWQNLCRDFGICDERVDIASPRTTAQPCRIIVFRSDRLRLERFSYSDQQCPLGLTWKPPVGVLQSNSTSCGEECSKTITSQGVRPRKAFN